MKLSDKTCGPMRFLQTMRNRVVAKRVDKYVEVRIRLLAFFFPPPVSRVFPSGVVIVLVVIFFFVESAGVASGQESVPRCILFVFIRAVGSSL